MEHDEIRALSVRQPWANLIASGRKTVELRGWSTRYRGTLLICAGRAIDRRGADWLDDAQPRGCAICLVELVDVRLVSRDDEDASCFDGAGIDPTYRFAWVLRDPRAVEPLPIAGRLGLFTPPPIALAP